MKRMAEVGRLAEPKRTRDIVDRHLRVAQILGGHFRPQLIEDLPERRSFVAQFPAERPFGDVEVRGDILQAHRPSKLAEQEAADLSRDSDPMLETVMQVVAEGQHRGVGDVVAELGSAVEPGRIKDQPVRRLPKGDRASELLFIMFRGSGGSNVTSSKEG